MKTNAGSLPTEPPAQIEASSPSVITTAQMSMIEQERIIYIRFYFLTVWCFFIIGLIPDYRNESLGVQTFIRWLFLFLLVIPTSLSIKGLGFSLPDVGLTTKNWRVAITESTFIFLLIIPFMFIAKMYVDSPINPLFSWGDLSDYSANQLWFYIISYLPHTFGQEFVARGVGIAFAIRILNDQKTMLPIFWVSIIFAAFHVHLSIGIATIPFCSSLLFGVVYRRHKTLIGVGYLHFLIGIAATAVGLI